MMEEMKRKLDRNRVRIPLLNANLRILLIVAFPDILNG
jgi:hypothetical protein